MKELFDPIRKIWVPALPEEVVRQNLLLRLIEELKFPKNLIAVEKEIAAMPHILSAHIENDRRADIICYAKNIHPGHTLYPLLLIECKAEKISEKVLQQALGYNQFVQAFFVCIASKESVRTFWHDKKKKEYVSCEFIPKYQELLDAVKT